MHLVSPADLVFYRLNVGKLQHGKASGLVLQGQMSPVGSKLQCNAIGKGACD